MISLAGVVEIGRHWIQPKQNACWWRQKHQLPLKQFETKPIEEVSKHRLLGVTVDEQIKWQTHINNICTTVSRRKKLSKLSQFVSHTAKLPFFFEHVKSHLNCISNARDGCACVHTKQLYSLHKRALKFLMPNPNMDYNQKCGASSSQILHGSENIEKENISGTH